MLATYIGKPIKVGFAINYANPALNLYIPHSQRDWLCLKTGKLQLINWSTLNPHQNERTRRRHKVSIKAYAKAYQ